MLSVIIFIKIFRINDMPVRKILLSGSNIFKILSLEKLLKLVNIHNRDINP